MTLKPIPYTADGSGPKGAIPISVSGTPNPTPGAIPVDLYGVSGGGEPWIPEPGPGQLTTTASMFQSEGWAELLTRVELFDTSNVTDMSFMFEGCSSLESVPLFDTSNVTNISNMFNGCPSLVEVELSDCSKVTDASNMFGGSSASTQATSLERLILPGLTRGFDLIGTNMGASALNDLFHSLGTASGVQEINITGAPGAATCDKSIATAKGWTITG